MKNLTKKLSDKWIIINAQGKILGRLASQIANILTGKNDINYSANKISHNYVIIINADKFVVSGNKLNNKKYYKHSGYPGNMKVTTLKAMLSKNPTFIIKNAVKGMLPKNKLQSLLLKNLKLYTTDIHPHNAQQPKLIEN